MESQRRGEGSPRPCTSMETTKHQNRSGCTCYSKNRCEKSTQIVTNVESGTISFKQNPITKKSGCTRCYHRRKNIPHEFESYAGSRNIFYGNYNGSDSQGSSVSTSSSPSSWLDILPEEGQPVNKDAKNHDSLTPKEIMNTWMPGRVRPAEHLFTPSTNYVDVSPRDFSLRKYLPELFLSEDEKNRMRAEEREKLQEIRPRQNESEGPKCPQGKCTDDHLRLNQDWRTIVEGPAIRNPCPWSDEDIALLREREEVTDEESNVKVSHTPPKRPISKWFRWPCRKFKQAKKSDGNKQDK